MNLMTSRRSLSGWAGDTLTLFEKGTQAALVLNSICG